MSNFGQKHASQNMSFTFADPKFLSAASQGQNLKYGLPLISKIPATIRPEF